MKEIRALISEKLYGTTIDAYPPEMGFLATYIATIKLEEVASIYTSWAGREDEEQLSGEAEELGIRSIQRNS